MDEVTLARRLAQASSSSELSEGQAKWVRDLVTEWDKRYGDAENHFTAFVLIAERDLDSVGALAGARARLAELAVAREELRTSIRLAALNGIPETRIAELAGVSRGTVRAALGK